MLVNEMMVAITVVDQIRGQGPVSNRVDQCVTDLQRKRKPTKSN